MKKTLLALVQDIMNDMDSDPVNSIDDTFESEQVAQIVRSTYENLMSQRNWEHQKQLIQLNPFTDVEKPNYLKVPESIKELIFFRYDIRKKFNDRIQYKELMYKNPDEFLRMVSGRNSQKENISAIKDFSGTLLLIQNDMEPTFWTSFDDEYIVTDAWNTEFESTLQANKTQCLAYITPKWEHRDDFVPDIPIEAFPVLKEQAKSTAFYSLKQMGNDIAQQNATYLNRRMSRKNWQVKDLNRFPDYGRRTQK